MMTGERLLELTSGFQLRRIAILGDFFLDKYIEVDPALAEISLETGKVANQVVKTRHSPGAAGTILSNVVALGAGEVVPVGFTGDDGEGYELRQDLSALGCTLDYLITAPDRSTPTYLKPRDLGVSGLAGERERYDTKNRISLPPHVESKIIEMLRDVVARVDAVIIADQADEAECGVVTTYMREAIAETARLHPDVIFWVDSRQRVGLFTDCIIKPNAHEAIRSALGMEHKVDLDTAIQASRTLNSRTHKPVFLTASEQGMLVIDKGQCIRVPAVRVEGPIDPTGAGDSATAGAVMTLASGGSLTEAALIANLVASITVCQIDTTGTADVAGLPARLELWRKTNSIE